MYRPTYRSLCALAFVALAGCPGGGDDAGGACDLDFLSANINATFDSGPLDALLEASGKFNAEITALDTELHDACNSMSTRLGGAEGTTTEAACDNARLALEGKLAANANVTLVLSVTPPVCSASASAVIECTAECDASFDATATPPTCEGGELSGTCSGQCAGECTASGNIACSGSCSGSCSGTCTGSVSGSCSGTCNGRCEGTCSQTAADGSCMGTCTGTCEGSCTGTITGTCNGSCSGMCQGDCRSTLTGSCTGSCSGTCDVMFTEPRCEGGHFDVEADADCEAACESQSSFDVECSDPQVVVTFIGASTTQADVDAILVAIEEDYPHILNVLTRLRVIADASADLAGTLDGAASAAASAGAEGIACLAEAVRVVAAAAATVMVDVTVSVEVQGSVTAGTR